MTVDEIRESLLGLTLRVEDWYYTGRRSVREGEIVAVEKYAVMHNYYGCCVVSVKFKSEGEILPRVFLYDDMLALLEVGKMNASFGDGSVGYTYELKCQKGGAE